MRKIVAGVLGALMALTATSCGSSGPTAKKTTSTTKAPAIANANAGILKGKTAAQILKAATAAATKSGSAHYVLSAIEGTSSQTISGDASMTGGDQTVAQGAQHIQVVYVGGVAYVQGNASGLTSAMGFAATVATNYANKWIAVHSTDSLFKSIVSAVTLTGTLSQLNPTGTLSVTGPSTVAGRKAVGVKGGLPGTPQAGVTGSTTLFVATTDPTVPLEFSGTAAQGTQHVQDKGTFTDWGKPLKLTAPTGSVPFSSVPTK
ncbi:MAG TPA: hypothetical protein VMU64_05035 [Acidimicrobiales bacterium]|nr:hypothetical protein [Acidimicrobiales bacterium]